MLLSQKKLMCYLCIMEDNLEYPLNINYILRKKKLLKRELLNKDNLRSFDEKINKINCEMNEEKI